MGGVRNREEKKKKAHVYSSGGGGGGTKGPDKVDKRNQEENCPYCERIFKQKDRLRQHIQKQHPNEAAPDEQQPGGSSSGGGNPEQQGGAAGSAGGGGAQQAPAGGDENGKGKQRMEVGAKGGYYTEKSPKMFLHEFCMKEKRPKPKYRASQVGGGGWTCKVVLPDPKKSEKDVVVFLEESRATSSAEEAEQLAAVKALHRVQGDRAMERVLPREYRDVWEQLGASAKEKAEATAAREAAAARRKEAEKRRKDKEARMAPMVVTMSDEKRALVEEALRNAQQGRLEDEAYEGSAGGHVAMGTEEEMEELLSRLQGLGFREQDAQEAANELEFGSEMDAYLDWLCLRVPEEHLPSRYAHSVEAKPVAVRFVATHEKGASAAGGQLDSEQDAEGPGEGLGDDRQAEDVSEDPAVAELQSFGYRAADAKEALLAAEGDIAKAVASLLAKLMAHEDSAEDHGGDDEQQLDESRLEEWNEERVALEAIYEEECQFEGPMCTRIRIPLADHGVIGNDGKEVPVAHLTVWPRPGGPAYPHSSPVLALAAPGLETGVLRAATAAVAAMSHTLLGSPMIYELVAEIPAKLCEALASIQAPASATGASARPERAPPAAAPAGAKVSSGVADTGARQKERSRQRSRGQGQQHPRIDVKKESEQLLQEWRAWQAGTSPDSKAMRRTRAALPAGKQRSEVLESAAQSQVLVVSGATGCGKSTQVPQFLLEQWISEGRGGACNIVCTQPRRISAVGLAARVAAERGEAVGCSVGYSVRLESKRSPRTRLLFCTIGILLRRLMGDSELSQTTHVVVDEVHERSVDSDLLLLLLRDLAARRRDLQIVLMSATADADMFSDYFRKEGLQTVRVDIPGFTYPVREFYLEDIFERTGYAVGRTSRYAKKSKPSSGKSGGNGSTGQMQQKPEKAAAPEEIEAPDSWENDDSQCSSNSSRGNLVALAEEDGLSALSEQTRRSLSNVDEAFINDELLCTLVAHIVDLEARRGPEALLEGWSPNDSKAGTGSGGQGARSAGAILVFLPGAPEISRLQRALGDNAAVRTACDAGGCQLRVLPLHGALPTSQQARVFEWPPKNVRKVVLATNVAETSITIDDVTCVIDCGRVKEMGFDAAVGMCQLKETWVSQAAAQQRRGRAGRVQRGTCFRVFSRGTWRRMSPYQAPEILRVPLQSLCMQIRSTISSRNSGGGSLKDILGRALTPPDSKALSQALDVLQSIQALDQSEDLTPLGRHLAQLPLDVHVGKMLVHAVVLRCLDPCLTIAAALGHGRSAWVSAPPDRREEAKAAKQVIAQAAGTTSKSDHLLLVAAYNMWVKTRETAGRQAGHTFCGSHFLSEQVMEAIMAARKDLAASLADMGAIPPSYLTAMRGTERNAAWRSANAAASNANLVKVALCAGFYPNILRVEHPAQRYKQVEAGTMASDAAPQEIRFFERTKGRVFLHPASTNFDCGRFESNWLVFTEMVETSKVFVRDTSMVPAFAMLLFGGAMKVIHNEGLVTLDGWATFKVPARVAVLLQELRAEVGRLLAVKMDDLSLDLSCSPVSDAMFQLLATDGF